MMDSEKKKVKAVLKERNGRLGGWYSSWRKVLIYGQQPVKYFYPTLLLAYCIPPGAPVAYKGEEGFPPKQAEAQLIFKGGTRLTTQSNLFSDEENLSTLDIHQLIGMCGNKEI